MLKKTLIFSLLLLSTMVGPAVAFDIPELYTSIQVNPGLRGDVLLGCLYDVRDLDGLAQQTLINIVNTDPVYGVVVRFRFRDYKRSHEVLDFHVPLSKNDVWSAVIYKSLSGRAYLHSFDPISKDIADSASFWPLILATDPNGLDTVDPVIPGAPTDPFGGKGVPFSTLNVDGNVARTIYGEFEIIGEERVAGDFDFVNKRVLRVDLTTPCGVGFYGVGGLPGPGVCGRDAQNSLFGETWLVRVDNGIAEEYQLLALSNFSVNTAGIKGTVVSQRPNLQDDAQGAIGQPGFGALPQVEFVLSKRNIFAQYVNDQGVLANTSVVVSFPTKWVHFSNTTPFPVQSLPFVGPNETIQDGLSDAFLFIVYDREEHPLTSTPGEPIFSPVQTGTPNVPRWPFEVNVVGLYDHAITAPSPSVPPASLFRDNAFISTFDDDQHFTAGWIRFDLSPNTADLPAGVTGDQGAAGDFNFFDSLFSEDNFTAYRGLPVIGIVLTEVVNLTIGTQGGYYGAAVPWASAVDWTADTDL